MKVIVYKQNDGRIAINAPTTDESSTDFLKDIPLNVPYKIVANLNIDNVFFDAYEFDQELGAKINISKTKAIHLDKFRAVRLPLLADLDVDFMRAVETGNKDLQKKIAVKKQALRDVTKMDLPNTLEEIKATWPEILGQNPFVS